MSDDDRCTGVSCHRCGEDVDIIEPGHFKSPSDQFYHENCLAIRTYESRDQVLTEIGTFGIDAVVEKRVINDGESVEILDRYWQAKCPQCWTKHRTEDDREDVRDDLVDMVLDCCGLEWVPPDDYVEDCDICGYNHREANGCQPLGFRDPFPDPENHQYECTDCDWTGAEGEDFDDPDGHCPECGTAAVRAMRVMTDGGHCPDDQEQVLSHDERVEHFGEEKAHRIEWWTEQLDRMETIQYELLERIRDRDDLQIAKRGQSVDESGKHEMSFTLHVAGQPFKWSGEDDE